MCVCERGGGGGDKARERHTVKEHYTRREGGRDCEEAEREHSDYIKRRRDTGRYIFSHPKKMPNFAGTWKMKSSEHFDDLLKALGKPKYFQLLCILR